MKKALIINRNYRCCGDHGNYSFSEMQEEKTLFPDYDVHRFS